MLDIKQKYIVRISIRTIYSYLKQIIKISVHNYVLTYVLVHIY